MKYSLLGPDYPMVNVGIRPGEKIHEVLVNEYEMQRAVEGDRYFTILPEYRPAAPTKVPLGVEYTSENTQRLRQYEDIGQLLDSMGPSEEYV